MQNITLHSLHNNFFGAFKEWRENRTRVGAEREGTTRRRGAQVGGGVAKGVLPCKVSPVAGWATAVPCVSHDVSIKKQKPPLLKELRKWQNTRESSRWRTAKKKKKIVETFSFKIREGCLSGIHNSGFSNTGASSQDPDGCFLFWNSSGCVYIVLKLFSFLSLFCNRFSVPTLMIVFPPGTQMQK